jgi:hypothetical protein
MNSLIIIPLISTFLFCLIKFFEKRFCSDKDKLESYALKYVFRDALLIFGVTLSANYIYTNIHDHIDILFDLVTETKALPFGSNAEIFTDSPNF